MKDTPLKVNDFFCGAGGMGLGFKQAGFRLAGAWDFDKYAVESYGNNVSPKVKQIDITEMNWQDVPYADVWTFGFPCQDVSTAGYRKGIIKGETRSGLFYEIMRLLDETKENNIKNMPKILLAENVKGIEDYLSIIEEEFEKRGYKLKLKLFNSKDWGVPQKRKRYFIVGIHESIKKEFLFPELEEQHIITLADILESNVDDKYYISDERYEHAITNNYSGLLKPDGLARTLRVGGVGSLSNKHNYEHILTGNRIRKLTEREMLRLQGFPEDYKIVVEDKYIRKQMGNAVSVPVAKAIAEEIHKFLE